MPVDSTERDRRRAALNAHLTAEVEHDVDRTMTTFSAETEMIYNGQRFDDHDTIRLAHLYMGFDGGGALADLTADVDRESFTDEEIVIEGRMRGRHVGEFQGFAPTNRDVELPFVAFYRFDGEGKLVSERIVMNLGTLGAQPTWPPGALDISTHRSRRP